MFRKNRRTRNALARAFTPDDLFEPFAAGFYGDAARFDKSFTTSGGSTNVTAAGDPVGRIDRLAGTLTLTQATSSARPTLARFPKSGLRNLALTTEDFRSAGNGNTISFWSNTNISVALAQGTAPDGTNTLNKATCNSNGAALTTNSVAFPAGSTITVTVYAKKDNCDFIRLAVSGAGGSECNCWFNIATGATGNNDAGLVNITFSAKSIASTSVTGLYRCRLTFTTATITSISALIYNCTANGGSSVNGNVVLLWGMQVEAASSAGAYQKVTALYDVTETGQPDVWMDYYDGGDYFTTGVQSFGTASLFAAAGQAWTVAGAFRTLQTTTGVFLSKCLSVTTLAQFFIFTIANELRVRVRGTLNQGLGAGAGDGGTHIWLLVWDGSSLIFYFDQSAPVTLSVGTAVGEAANILAAARNEPSLDGFFTGHMTPPLLIDRALSASEIQQELAYMRSRYQP